MGARGPAGGCPGPGPRPARRSRGAPCDPRHRLGGARPRRAGGGGRPGLRGAARGLARLRVDRGRDLSARARDADAGVAGHHLPGRRCAAAAPRIDYFDERDAALRPPILAHCARRRTAQGYVLAVVMALDSIGLSPSLGTTVEVRVLVDHRRPGVARLRQAWSTRCADEYTAVRLGAAHEASAPIDAAAWGATVGYDEFAACAILPSSRVGEALRVRQDGAILAEARAVPWRGRALAALRACPSPWCVPGRRSSSASRRRPPRARRPPPRRAWGWRRCRTWPRPCPTACASSPAIPRLSTARRAPRSRRHGVRGEFIFRGPRFPRLEVGSASLRRRGAPGVLRHALARRRGQGGRRAREPRPLWRRDLHALRRRHQRMRA